MIAGLIQMVKKKEDSYASAAPLLKFIGMLGILLTFLVFNIMLAGAEGRDPQANWRVGSLCFHVVLPIIFPRSSKNAKMPEKPLFSLSMPQFLMVSFVWKMAMES